MENETVFFLLGTAVSAYGVLVILDPERAFKLHHLLQIREVEFTQYGKDSAVIGGFLSIVIGWLFVGAMLSLAHAILSVVAATVPLLYLYRHKLRRGPDETAR